MGHIYVTKDNKNHTVFGEKDIVDIVREYAGYEIADLVEEKIDSISILKKIETERLDTDLSAYESQLEEYVSYFNDIQDLTAELQSELDKPRLNREELRRLAESITIASNNF